MDGPYKDLHMVGPYKEVHVDDRFEDLHVDGLCQEYILPATGSLNPRN